jgi:hypothetical protein
MTVYETIGRGNPTRISAPLPNNNSQSSRPLLAPPTLLVTGWDSLCGLGVWLETPMPVERHEQRKEETALSPLGNAVGCSFRSGCKSRPVLPNVPTTSDVEPEFTLRGRQFSPPPVLSTSISQADHALAGGGNLWGGGFDMILREQDNKNVQQALEKAVNEVQANTLRYVADWLEKRPVVTVGAEKDFREAAAVLRQDANTISP